MVKQLALTVSVTALLFGGPVLAFAAPMNKTGRFCPGESFFQAKKRGCYPKAVRSKHDITQALFRIMPWYPKEQAVQSNRLFKACGYRAYFVRSQRVGRRWRAPEIASGFLAFGKLRTLKRCRIPRSNKLAPARKVVMRFLGGRRNPQQRWNRGDSLVAQGGWNIERHKISGRVIGRWAEIRHYSRKHQYKAGACGGPDTVACEFSGSKTAKAINVIHWRIKEGRLYKSRGNRTACFVTAWAAVSTAGWLKRFHARGLKSGSWRKGLSYKTRWSGMLNDRSAFALVDRMERSARALFLSCGGNKGWLPDANRDGDFRLREAY